MQEKTVCKDVCKHVFLFIEIIQKIFFFKKPIANKVNTAMLKISV